MSVKIKDKPAKQKISKFNFNTKVCEVPETSMFFSFQYITSDKHYNIEYLKRIVAVKKMKYILLCYIACNNILKVLGMI